jgi:phage gp29-like protein
MLGVCFAQNIYDTESVPGRWIPRLDPWHPSHFRYEATLGHWIANTKEGPLTVDLLSGKWAAYSLDGKSPWLEGLVRRLAIPWLIRQLTYRDWARYSEIHGLPIRKATIPAEASKEQKDNFWAGIVELGNESTIEIPELGNGQGAFDLELVEAASKSWEGFKELLSKCESSISITILGQNLTTEVKGGSLAAAQVHENVKHDFISDDAVTFCDAFRDGVLRPFTVFNYGDTSLTPTLKIDTEPPADLKSDAETLKTLGEALTAFNTAGYTLDPKDIEAKYGVKLSPISQVGDISQVGANPQEGNTKPPEPKPKGAPAKAKGEGQPIRLASGYAVSPQSGFIEGQLYMDALTDGAVSKAVKAIAPDLATIGQIINQAKDYEELRANLLTAFEGAPSPDEFAGLMQKALTLAKLGGRTSLAQDL